MEASEYAPITQPAVTVPDVASIHSALDEADEAYHSVFGGHVADEIHRFEQFLATVRMVVDQSADMASKE